MCGTVHVNEIDNLKGSQVTYVHKDSLMKVKNVVLPKFEADVSLVTIKGLNYPYFADVITYKEMMLADNGKLLSSTGDYFMTAVFISHHMLVDYEYKMNQVLGQSLSFLKNKSLYYYIMSMGKHLEFSFVPFLATLKEAVIDWFCFTGESGDLLVGVYLGLVRVFLSCYESLYVAKLNPIDPEITSLVDLFFCFTYGAPCLQDKNVFDLYVAIFYSHVYFSSSFYCDEMKKFSSSKINMLTFNVDEDDNVASYNNKDSDGGVRVENLSMENKVKLELERIEENRVNELNAIKEIEVEVKKEFKNNQRSQSNSRGGSNNKRGRGGKRKNNNSYQPYGYY